MENKHTPGPWIVDSWSSSGWSVRSKIGLAISSKRYRNELTGQEYRDEMLANAHLIAAAPDLLDALENCVARMIEAQEASGYPHAITILEAQDAIRKAKGEIGGKL